jgi:hypothetical protein
MGCRFGRDLKENGVELKHWGEESKKKIKKFVNYWFFLPFFFS